MMLAYRLVRLIETHSDALADGLLARVQNSECTQCYRNVASPGIEKRVSEIYRHLGRLVDGQKQVRYRNPLSEKLASTAPCSRDPISQLAMAIIFTKENLWEFLQKEAVPDRPAEVFGELEMLQLFDQFL